MNAADELTDAVKALAMAEGFARVGVAPAGGAREPARQLREWLSAGRHGEMAYLARNLDRRLDPGRLVAGARSVICLAVGYAPGGPAPAAQPAGPVAAYARGRDYHRVLRKRCRRLMDRIRRAAPDFDGRAFVDTGPVMERRLAARAGVGWIGRNGCLVCPALGSYVLLCEIICNLPLRPDEPLVPQCHTCDACISACPTGAFVGPGLIDARRCVSYLTIEHRGPIDPEFRPRMGARVFGCDACQSACPHNLRLPPGDAGLLRPEGAPRGAGVAQILAWRREDWDAATRGSATRRATYEMFLRNAVIAAGNSGDASLRAGLLRLRRSRPELDALVGWALGRLEAPPAAAAGNAV